MPILDKKDVSKGEFGTADRWTLVSSDNGADSLTVADLVLEPGAIVPVHVHPKEEAMVIVEGELEAILGDQIITVSEWQTVLAPPGVRHGFKNTSGLVARIMAIHPTAHVQRTLVD